MNIEITRSILVGRAVSRQSGLETFRNVNQARFIRELRQTESMLNGLINRLDQKRAEFIMRAEPQATVAFENLRLHPLIANACTGLYRDGHYRQAILDGSIALVNLVKDRLGINDLDGADLMRKVFSRKSPRWHLTLFVTVPMKTNKRGSCTCLKAQCWLLAIRPRTSLQTYRRSLPSITSPF